MLRRGEWRLTMEQEWLSIKNQLQKSLSRGQYDLWVSTLDFLGLEEGRLVLGCRNRFHVEWLREKLELKLLAALRQHFPQVQKLDYRIVSEPRQDRHEEEMTEGPRQVSMADLIKRSSPAFNPRFTFDRFVVGTSNQFAYATALAMADNRQVYNQSVFLLSDTGLGKSHLTHAVGNYLHVQRPELRVQYATAEQFANEMIYSIKNGSMEAFKNKFRAACDVLLLEKIEFFSGKEKIQSELVFTLDELMDRGKKILCTGNTCPKDIPRLSMELQSRLSGIMVAPIERPDFKTRIEIIRHKTRSENVVLPMEIMEFLADRITGDVRQLESCLVGMIAKANILNVPICIDLARDVTQTMLDRLPKITVDHIQKVVCASFQITPEELRSPSRKKDLAMARKIAMYLSRQYTTESLNSIGKSFKRSHSSVLYAVNGLAREMAGSSSKLKRQVEYVSRRLETSCLST